VSPGREHDVSRFARRAVARATAEVDHLRDVDVEDVGGLHDLRIAFKHLRYAIEAFADVLPSDVAAARDPAVKFQKRLGEIHDIDMALDAMAHARTLGPTTRTALRAALVELRAQKEAHFEAERRPLPKDVGPEDIAELS